MEFLVGDRSGWARVMRNERVPAEGNEAVPRKRICRQWTAEEDALIASVYRPRCSLASLQSVLPDRSEWALRCRISALGLLAKIEPEPPPREWCEAEDRILRSRQWKSDSKIVAALKAAGFQRSARQTKSRRVVLRLVLARATGDWSDQEDAVIRKHYRSCFDWEAVRSQLPGRTEKSAHARAWRLGLRRRA